MIMIMPEINEHFVKSAENYSALSWTFYKNKTKKSLIFVAVSVLISLCLYLHTVICASKHAVADLLLQFYVYSPLRTFPCTKQVLAVWFLCHYLKLGTPVLVSRCVTFVRPVLPSDLGITGHLGLGIIVKLMWNQGCLLTLAPLLPVPAFVVPVLPSNLGTIVRLMLPSDLGTIVALWPCHHCQTNVSLWPWHNCQTSVALWPWHHCQTSVALWPCHHCQTSVTLWPWHHCHTSVALWPWYHCFHLTLTPLSVHCCLLTLAPSNQCCPLTLTPLSHKCCPLTSAPLSHQC